MDTLLISPRNHRVDPQAYLRNVIERLPANYAAAHPAIKSDCPQAA